MSSLTPSEYEKLRRALVLKLGLDIEKIRHDPDVCDCIRDSLMHEKTHLMRLCSRMKLKEGYKSDTKNEYSIDKVSNKETEGFDIGSLNTLRGQEMAMSMNMYKTPSENSITIHYKHKKGGGRPYTFTTYPHDYYHYGSDTYDNTSRPDKYPILVDGGYRVKWVAKQELQPMDNKGNIVYYEDMNY